MMDILESLNLPEPHKLKTSDLEFKRLYEKFVKSIRYTFSGDKSSIICDSEIFDHPGPAAVRLLCALIRPTAKDVGKMKSCIRKFKRIKKGEYGDDIDPEIYLLLKEFSDFRTTKLYKEFTGGRKRTTDLLNFKYAGSDSPASSWEGEFDIRGINEEWAIVLTPRGLPIEWGVFPLVIGFANTENLIQSVGSLLLKNKSAWFGNCNWIVGDHENDLDVERLVHCFTGGGKDGPLYGAFALSLDEKELELIGRIYGKRSLERFINELKNVFLKYRVMEDRKNYILYKYRPITSDTLKQIEIDLEGEIKVAEVERKRKLKIDNERRNRNQDALSPLSPAEFPPETLVSDLTKDEYFQLNRWLEVVKGIRDLRIEERIEHPALHMNFSPNRKQFYDFCAVFLHDGKEERKYFNKKTSLTDAFKEIFTIYSSK